MTIGKVVDHLKLAERTIYRLAAAKKIHASQAEESRHLLHADILTPGSRTGRHPLNWTRDCEDQK